MASSLPLLWGDYRHGLDTAMILHSKLIVNLNYSVHYYNVFTYKMMCDNKYIEEFRRSNARVFLPARLTCGSRTGVPFLFAKKVKQCYYMYEPLKVRMRRRWCFYFG